MTQYLFNTHHAKHTCWSLLVRMCCAKSKVNTSFGRNSLYLLHINRRHTIPWQQTSFGRETHIVGCIQILHLATIWHICKTPLHAGYLMYRNTHACTIFARGHNCVHTIHVFTMCTKYTCVHNVHTVYMCSQFCTHYTCVHNVYTFIFMQDTFTQYWLFLVTATSRGLLSDKQECTACLLAHMYAYLRIKWDISISISTSISFSIYLYVYIYISICNRYYLYIFIRSSPTL